MIEAFNVMKWPLVACLLLPGILVYYGLHIVRREIIFVDLALAQVAALGTCLAIGLGYSAHDWQRYGCSVGFTLVGAVIFTLTRSHPHRVPQEALIGIVYVVAAAAGILLLSASPSGDEELRHTLIGEVLLVRWQEIAQAFALYVLIGFIHYLFRRQFLMVSFEPERALAEGLPLLGWDFLFYVLFGLVVTTFVPIGGVLLVFSFLIIPAVGASFLAQNLKPRLILAWSIATLGGVLGLVASFFLNLPTGAAIVCVLGALLVLSALAARFR